MSECDGTLAALRAHFDASYPSLWQSMLRELADGTDDRLWLTAAASYLFRAKGVRWAVDPVFRHPEVIDAVNAGQGRALECLSFALYTHGHNDHVHVPTIQALVGMPLKWVVPHFMREKIVAAGVSADRLIQVRAGETVVIDGVTIRAFDGRHYDAGTRLGVESLWYFVEAGGRRVFLPGDVRDYDLSRMPGSSDKSVL